MPELSGLLRCDTSGSVRVGVVLVDVFTNVVFYASQRPVIQSPTLIKSASQRSLVDEFKYWHHVTHYVIYQSPVMPPDILFHTSQTQRFVSKCV